jgi:D-alanine-D-alanine ligase
MKNLAIVCGGYSKESIVSLKSAESIMEVIDQNQFNPFVLYIDKNTWVVKKDNDEYRIDKNDFSCTINNKKITFDAVFMAIHGTPGEDGKLQAYFEILNIPFTTCDSITSAITFNKYATKQYLKPYNIAMCDIILLRKGVNYNTETIANKLGFPLFVKPNAGGSSFGVSKVKNIAELEPAIEKAFAEDNEVVIEPFIDGREFTCGVFKSDELSVALPVTEIVSKTEFFDYEAKYEGKSDEITPAHLSKEQTEECQQISSTIYDLFNCKGMVRIDFILSNDTFHFMEINTVPGMSKESIIPQQVRANNMNVSEFYTALINDAISRNAQ